MDYLTRGQAPFANDVWEQLDKAAIAAARDLLTGRRFLPLEGPFGIGLTAIEYGEDDYYRHPGPGAAAGGIGRAVSVPMIRKIVHISTRLIAANLENQQPLDLSPVEDAAEAVAEREEDLIYRGVSDFH